jgi:hypothetical protein
MVVYTPFQLLSLSLSSLIFAFTKTSSPLILQILMSFGPRLDTLALTSGQIGLSFSCCVFLDNLSLQFTRKFVPNKKADHLWTFCVSRRAHLLSLSHTHTHHKILKLVFWVWFITIESPRTANRFRSVLRFNFRPNWLVVSGFHKSQPNSFDVNKTRRRSVARFAICFGSSDFLTFPWLCFQVHLQPVTICKAKTSPKSFKLTVCFDFNYSGRSAHVFSLRSEWKSDFFFVCRSTQTNCSP